MPPATVTDVLIGRTIAGKYVIESFLGGGAMGSVYRARQFALDKVVAIKVMRGELTTDRSFVGRFRREAKAASKLAHANSINVTDFGEESDGLLYLVMEFVAGRDLEQIMVDDGVPLADVRIAEILSQVLSAVAVAHDAGIVHRDLKPANILIVAGTDDEGHPVEHVKVCDFGIASMRSHDEPPGPVPTAPTTPGQVPRPGVRRIDSGKKLTAIGALLGTPEYMSPEQASGYALGPASDIYSIGAILYELLTGRTLYDADSPEAMVLQQIVGTPVDPRVLRPGCNDGLATICLRALEKKPEDRYATARAMRSELRILLGHGYGSRTATQQAIVISTDSMRPPSLGSLPVSSLHPTSSNASGAMQVHVLTPVSGVPISRSLREKAETMVASTDALGPTATPPPATQPAPHKATLREGSGARPAYELDGAGRTPMPPPRAARGRWIAAAALLVLVASGGGFFLSRGPSKAESARVAANEPPITQTVTTVTAPGAITAAPAERSPSVTTASAADVTVATAQQPPVIHPGGHAGAAGVAGARSAAATSPGARAAEPVAAAPEPPPAAIAAPAPAPVPEPTPAAPAVTAAPAPVAPAPEPVKPFSPDGARVTATVTAAARTSRATVTSIVGHTSFDACYRDALRSLGRPEGGAGSAHLEVDEDGIIANVQVRLPASLSSAAPCFASKLRGQRVANPDTGAATADVSFVLTPH